MEPFQGCLIELGPTPDSTCPYLTDRNASLVFYQPIYPSLTDFDYFMAQGYRRHGSFFYKPRCPLGCQECIPIRIPIENYLVSKSQRRVLRKCQDIYEVNIKSPSFDEEHLELFNRHAAYVSPNFVLLDGEEYIEFLLNGGANTLQIEYRISGNLVGVSFLDLGKTVASSIYFFWNPDFSNFNPGTFSALWEIQWSSNKEYQYYYLGYWVRDCASMSYKNRFKPYELMDWNSGEWKRSV